MRWLVCLPLLFVPGPCKAWDTTPHRRITKAALDALPARLLNRFGKEAAPLVEIYCMYPDRYVEMASYGFVRNSPGPRTVSEILNYCVRPDGELLHGATGDRDMDFGSLQYLFENIVANSSRNRPDEAAKYAGVLSHFIADSLSPPHAVTPERLLDMKPWWLSAGGVNIHSAIEKSLPEFALSGRAPRMAGAGILPAVQAVLEQCYAGAAQNRKNLPSMVKAACERDEPTLDIYRRQAGVKAAEILADALYAVLRIGEGVR